MKISFVLAAAATLTATAVSSAAAAAATPTGGGNAADTVAALESDGYNVQLNGTASVPLSRCTTTGVEGLPNSVDSSSPETNPFTFTTVYVDISCPDNV